LDMQLTDASVMEGYVLDGSAVVASSSMVITSSSGAVLTGSSNSLGSFRYALPAGQYIVYASKDNKTFWGEMSTGNANVSLTTGATLEGKVWTDIYYNGQMSNNPGWANFSIAVAQSNGWKLQLATDKSGKYGLVLPVGLDMTIDAVTRYYDPVSIAYTTTGEKVVKNIQLVPSLREVNGTLKIGASGLSIVTVQFIADGKGAVNATAITDISGKYLVQLRPGNYEVLVDQNVTSGNDGSHYQLLQSGYLNLTIGQSPTVKDLDAIVRFKVSGAIGPGEGTIKFSWPGLDNIVKDVNATYSVYVRPGNYSVYANMLSDRTRYVYLDRMNVTGAMSIDILAKDVDIVNLDAKYDSRGVQTPVRITNSSTGAYIDLRTSTSGSTSVYLPLGNYSAVVEYHTMEKLSISESAKYVLYSGSTDFSLVGSALTVHMVLNRTLDNSTVTGLPIGVAFQFNAISDSAISSKFTSTGADVAIAPGNYSVYGVNLANQVYFGMVSIDPYVINSPAITMGSGVYISGTTLLDGAGKQANMTITKGQLYVEVQSAMNGAYGAYLPVGAYVINASTSMTDKGIDIRYTGSVSFATVITMVKDIVMNKVVEAEVSLTWDSSQIKTVETGQSATYTVTVKNLGNILDSYNITYSGTGWNVTVTPTRVENLTYGSEGSVDLSVTIIPSATIYVDHAQRVSVRITSTTGSGASDVVSLDAKIVPHYGVNLTYTQALPQDNNNHVYSLKLLNSGNNMTSIVMVLTNVEELRENGWNVSMSTSESGVGGDNLTISKLAPGKVQVIKVSLTANRDDPNPDVMVNIFLRSIDRPDVVNELSFRAEFPILTVPTLAVTGNAVTLSLPEIPLETYVALIMVIMLAALVIYFSFLRGVLARKK
jgi:hypothetical protein